VPFILRCRELTFRLNQTRLQVSEIIILQIALDIKCSANYILLIEKECVFAKLVESRFAQKNNCIVFTVGVVVVDH
jgi:DNA topoisomerase VI subunit A